MSEFIDILINLVDSGLIRFIFRFKRM